MQENILKYGDYLISLENIEKGLYVFYNESGTGKSRLRKLLEKCHLYRKPVSAYSYETALLGLRPLDVCKPTDKLVLLDRYDMYQDEFVDDVRSLAENTSVIVDAKSAVSLPTKNGVCMLFMDSPNAFRIVGG